jgi:hypothetical protein
MVLDVLIREKFSQALGFKYGVTIIHSHAKKCDELHESGMTHLRN